MVEEARIGTLMLVDDSKIDQLMYQRIVKRSGKVDVLLPFLKAQAALDHLLDPSKSLPDLILLDINMPGMNGFEFLEAAEAAFGSSFAPVIVMLTTSLDPKDEIRAGTFTSVRDFRNKPLTAQMLEEFVALL